MGVATRDAERVSGGGSRGAEEGVTATLPELDLAIMNPPFTRSVGGNLLFGSLPATERRKLQIELSRRLKQRQASATAGLGAAFVAAASPKLRPGEGRLALVLPATVCTGPSWEQTRSLIERNFVLDMVVASHDPLRWNFSYSTDLSKALLIATRPPEKNDTSERRTTFVNLWRNPDGVLDAHRVAQAITATPPALFEGTGTALLGVDELGQVGPDRRDVWDGFERTDAVTAYPMVENHDTEQRKRLVAAPDKYLAPLAKPRPGRHLKSVAQLWPKAGRLLVAERLRLDTTRVVAMPSETRVLSNVWWPIRVGHVPAEKALVIWLNSSLGLLTILTQRTTTEGGWVAMKKADLEVLPVLDTRRLSQTQVQSLSDLFDGLAEAEFERLPGMATCSTRRSLDDGISRIPGLPNLTKLRDLLASEPVVSNRRL